MKHLKKQDRSWVLWHGNIHSVLTLPARWNSYLKWLDSGNYLLIVCSRYKSCFKYMFWNYFFYCGPHLFIFLVESFEIFIMIWRNSYFIPVTYFQMACAWLTLYVFLRSPMFLWIQDVCRDKMNKSWCTWCLISYSSNGAPKPWCLLEDQDQAWLFTTAFRSLGVQHCTALTFSVVWIFQQLSKRAFMNPH